MGGKDGKDGGRGQKGMGLRWGSCHLLYTISDKLHLREKSRRSREHDARAEEPSEGPSSQES